MWCSTEWCEWASGTEVRHGGAAPRCGTDAMGHVCGRVIIWVFRSGGNDNYVLPTDSTTTDEKRGSMRTVRGCQRVYVDDGSSISVIGQITFVWPWPSDHFKGGGERFVYLALGIKEV